ncbi:MAG: YhcH/YjgK/YiaL family protein [bacterium]
MIIDTLENVGRYECLNIRFKAAFHFLKNTNLAALQEGRYEIDGDRLFVLTQIYQTKPVADGKLEAHRKYIDIQFVVSGEEYIGYAPLADQKPVAPFQTEKDIGFYHGDASLTKISAGMFAIFYPNDAHLPSRYLQVASGVKKIVIKVACV